MRAGIVAGLLAVAVVGCAPRPAEPAPVVEAEPASFRAGPEFIAPADALARGVAYLLKHQSADGAWRSDVYATFKDGPALTPLAVCALQDAAAADAKPAARRGSEYLAKLVQPDGTTAGGDGGLDYPVYTAALSVIALSHPDNADLKPARDAWLRYLLDRQLTAKHGWTPADKEFGGWGYCRLIPLKPEPGKFAPPLVESNLSATAFALDALKAAGHADRATYDAALVFVRRCQNADGGFHFIYDDPVRNKAGAAAVGFHSYGSTTADGLRALLAADEPDRARRVLALRWLETHFRPDSHPGTYVPPHERNREAVYYYYAASAAKALRAAGVAEAGGKPWAAALAAELARRQAADGSWSNPVELVRENDPVVATCAAVTALAHCRAAK